MVDREVECQVYEYRQGPEGKESTHQDFFTATVFPHFLKRTVLRPSPNNQQPFPYALAYEVIATDLPVTRGERLLNAAETRTIIREPEKTTVIVELISDEVPGGLITKRTTQRAKDGRLLKRETVELDDFGLRTEPGEEQTRRRLFREWRQGLRERRTNRAGGGR